jgi:hypothetical protein
MLPIPGLVLALIWGWKSGESQSQSEGHGTEKREASQGPEDFRQSVSAVGKTERASE